MKVKARPGSEVIVDPQELTEFLRKSQDFSELIKTTLNPEDSEVIRRQKLRALQKNKISGPSEQNKAINKGWKRYIGIPVAIASGLFFILSLIATKNLIGKYHPFTISFWQYLTRIPIGCTFILYYWIFEKVNVFQSVFDSTEVTDEDSGDVTPSTTRQKIFTSLGLVLTCLAGVAVLVMRFYALLYLSVADATVINFSGTLFTIGFGYFFLDEKCGFVTLPISFVNLFGAFLITRPPFLTGGTEYNTDLLIGASIALMTTIVTSAYYVAMRKLRKIHYTVTIFLTSVLGAIECGVLAVCLDVFTLPDLGWDIFWISAVGFLAISGNLTIIIALKFEQAGIVNLVRLIDVVFVFFLEYIFLHIIPDRFSICGAIIVLTGVSIIALRSILLTLPHGNRYRRACCCLLK